LNLLAKLVAQLGGVRIAGIQFRGARSLIQRRFQLAPLHLGARLAD
jgi:hypothetical protein